MGQELRVSTERFASLSQVCGWMLDWMKQRGLTRASPLSLFSFRALPCGLSPGVRQTPHNCAHSSQTLHGLLGLWHECSSQLSKAALPSIYHRGSSLVFTPSCLSKGRNGGFPCSRFSEEHVGWNVFQLHIFTPALGHSNSQPSHMCNQLSLSQELWLESILTAQSLGAHPFIRSRYGWSTWVKV